VITSATGKTAKQVKTLLKSRQLSWAFDFALGSRQELRVLATELARLQGQPVPRVADFNDALQIIFPDAPPKRAGVVATVRASVVAARFAVKSDHVVNLVREGWLTLAPGEKFRRGPGGSPNLLFETVVEFLRRVRVA
jgi:hypothetical protein